MNDREEELEQAKQEACAIIAKLGDQIPVKARPLLEDVYTKMKVDHMLPREALDFSPSMMESIYQYGYNLFQNGKYHDAQLIFSLLRRLDITDLRYTFAIAACHHHAKEYLDAAANYLIYKYMDPLNPLPNYYLYDCYVKANYLSTALYVLQEGLVLCKRNSDYDELAAKMELEMEHLKKLLKEEYEKEYEPSA